MPVRVNVVARDTAMSVGTALCVSTMKYLLCSDVPEQRLCIKD